MAQETSLTSLGPFFGVSHDGGDMATWQGGGGGASDVETWRCVEVGGGGNASRLAVVVAVEGGSGSG